MFTTQGADSFPAHQDLIRGGTEIDANDSLIDNPPYGKAWGCDSAPGTATTLITTGLVLEPHAGPFHAVTRSHTTGRVGIRRCATCSTQSRPRGSTIRPRLVIPARFGTPSTLSRPYATAPSGDECQLAGDQRFQRHRERKAAGDVGGSCRTPKTPIIPEKEATPDLPG